MLRARAVWGRDAISNSIDFLFLFQNLMISTGKSGVGRDDISSSIERAKSLSAGAKDWQIRGQSEHGGGRGHSSLARLQGRDQSLAARSYFDPVRNELRVRAKEKERRKIFRQKRKDEIFASVS